MADTMLADPTDYGNEPGLGPLRVGGQSPKEGMSPARAGDRPDTRSPASEAQMDAVEKCRDLWGGNSKVKAAGQRYLPKAPGETPMDYQTRLFRAVFFNVFRQTIVGLIGLIYRKDPVLGDDVPARIREMWENIDLEGTHGDVFMKDITEDAGTVGHAAILVEFPVVNEVVPKDIEKANFRPYWVPIKKESLFNWRTATRNGVKYLTQVTIEIAQWVQNGEYGEKLRKQYLVIRHDLDATVDPVTWRLLEVSSQGIVSEEGQGVYKNQVEIPLAEVRTSGSESLFESQPPLLDLGELNLAHYRIWSDYETSIHKTCVPVMVLTGVDMMPDAEGEMPPPIIVGPNTVITLSDSQADAKYVSHNGESLGSVKAAMDDLKSDMGVLGISMLAPQYRQAETAEAKRMDKSTQDSSLAVLARGAQDAAERALGFTARYLGLDDGGSITINRDFEGLLMDAPVMRAYVELRKAGFPPRIVLKALQEGGRIPEDEDLEALEAEMEANRLADEALERDRMELDAREMAEA